MLSSPNRLLATVFGAVYVAVGLLGFTVTADVPFSATDGALLLGLLQVNALHNLAHLVIGVPLMVGGLTSVRAARRANSAIGGVLLVLGLVGLFLTGTDTNILALNGAGNVLHFGSAIVLLAAGLGAEKNQGRNTRATITR